MWEGGGGEVKGEEQFSQRKSEKGYKVSNTKMDKNSSVPFSVYCLYWCQTRWPNHEVQNISSTYHTMRPFPKLLFAKPIRTEEKKQNYRPFQHHDLQDENLLFKYMYMERYRAYIGCWRNRIRSMCWIVKWKLNFTNHCCLQKYCTTSNYYRKCCMTFRMWANILRLLLSLKCLFISL